MTDLVGIIYPPPDLRGIVDKTAQYVAKNGPILENKIKQDHSNNPKFSFLLSGDPFNAYYQHKVKEARDALLGRLEQQQQQQQSTPSPSQPDRDLNDSSTQNGQQDDQQIQPGPISIQQDAQRERTDSRLIDDAESDRRHHDHESRDTAQDNGHEVDDAGPRVSNKLNEYIQEKTVQLEEPPQLNFLANPAPSITHKESDLIKLTAQFIATHGRSFLVELVGREQNNAQFDFLKPQHGQFKYMTNLIMQYSLVRNHPLDIMEQLRNDASSQKHVLEKIKMRAEWEKMLENERRNREEEHRRERFQYSQIDWHDFVIVETVDYQPDEKGEYPPPTSKDQVGTRYLLQQRLEEQTAPQEMDIDMEESDVEDDSSVFFAEPLVPDALPPKLDMVTIKKDYDPKNKTSNQQQQQDSWFISPITNERIPADKMHEHVRYNLSDPRHLELKERTIQEKMNQEDVFAPGSQVESSLRSLAERRTDIFGLDDQETAIGRRIGEEETASAKDDRLIWDGHRRRKKPKS